MHLFKALPYTLTMVVRLLEPTTFSARQVYCPPSCWLTRSICRLPSRLTVTYGLEVICHVVTHVHACKSHLNRMASEVYFHIINSSHLRGRKEIILCRFWWPVCVWLTKPLSCSQCLSGSGFPASKTQGRVTCWSSITLTTAGLRAIIGDTAQTNTHKDLRWEYTQLQKFYISIYTHNILKYCF